jgi:hypothetical protein
MNCIWQPLYISLTTFMDGLVLGQRRIKTNIEAVAVLTHGTFNYGLESSSVIRGSKGEAKSGS